MSIYDRITDKIIEDLEKGIQPWIKRWDNPEPHRRPLRFNGIPYTGINTISLWATATARGYRSPTWMTYKQAKDLGAHVKRHEKGSLVVYANRLIVDSNHDSDHEDEEIRAIPFLKGYTVFNSDQIEGLPKHFYTPPKPRLSPIERLSNAEDFFRRTGARIIEGGNRAFYSQTRDLIQIPPIESFHEQTGYYATLAHECIHWTGHPTRLSRLDKDLKSYRWGDQGYALEELVAEIGSAFLCADLEISLEPRRDHASYISSWLNALQRDKRTIFKAASYAQRAADYLSCLCPLLKERDYDNEKSQRTHNQVSAR